MNVSDWLRQNGYEGLIEAFEREGVTIDMLPTLGDDELRALGIDTIGARRSFRAAAAQLVTTDAKADPERAIAPESAVAADARGVDPADPMRKVVLTGAALMAGSTLLPWLAAHGHTSGFGQSYSAKSGGLIGLATVWGMLGGGLGAAAFVQTRRGRRVAWMFGLFGFLVAIASLVDMANGGASASFGGASSSVRLKPEFGFFAYVLGTLTTVVAAFRLRGEPSGAERLTRSSIQGVFGLAALGVFAMAGPPWKVMFANARHSDDDLVGTLAVYGLGIPVVLWAADGLLTRLRSGDLARADALTTADWLHALTSIRRSLAVGTAAWALTGLARVVSIRFDAEGLTSALTFAEFGMLALTLGLLAFVFAKTLGQRSTALLPGVLALGALWYGWGVNPAITDLEALSRALLPLSHPTMVMVAGLAAVSLVVHRLKARPDASAAEDGLRAELAALGPLVVGAAAAVFGVAGCVVVASGPGRADLGTAALGFVASVLYTLAAHRHRVAFAKETLAMTAVALVAAFLFVSDFGGPDRGDVQRLLPVLALTGAFLSLSTAAVPRAVAAVAAAGCAFFAHALPDLAFGSWPLAELSLRIQGAESGWEGGLEGATLLIDGAPLSKPPEGAMGTYTLGRIPAGTHTWTITHPLADTPLEVDILPVPGERIEQQVPLTKGYLTVLYYDADRHGLRPSDSTDPLPPWSIDGKPLTDTPVDAEGRRVVPVGPHALTLTEPGWQGDPAQVDVPPGGTTNAHLSYIRRKTAEEVLADLEAMTQVQEGVSADSPAMGASDGPTVSLGEPTILGPLDKSLIERTLRSTTLQLQVCYQRELVRNPGLAGQITESFTINADGTVSEPTTASSSMNNPAVEQCVTERWGALTFPAPRGAGTVKVSYPVTFAPAK